ncbi:cilia- and flagella-associated protein 251-like isoform X2 [Toxorhynchites rutilus septentrionalis]|nr:cilia- and flagella-associated protein 251-like isoform X2 [Toxorhynchites rutilus septentrionalis]
MVMASANAIIFYKFENQIETTFTIVGHRTNINMLASDGTGRFVASSDSIHCINVWDRDASPGASPVAIRTIYEPFKSNQMDAVGLSHDGRYLIAACSGSQHQLKIWQWTVGNETTDDSIELPTRFGKTKNIRFCPDLDKRHYFVITLENAIIFGTFDAKNQKLGIEIPKKHGFQDYNDSVFVDDTPRAVSVTGAGMAIVWNDDDKIDGPVKKQFLKYLHLKYASINVIRSCDQKLITGDDDGEVRFYDNQMRILYWFKQEDPEPVRTISFNIAPRRCRIKYASFDAAQGKYDENNEPDHEDNDEEFLNIESVPRDVSLEGNPVIIRNFIMATKSGRIYDVDIVQNKIQDVYYQSGSIITAFDVNPKQAQLCCCDGNGRLTIYDLEEKHAVMSITVPIQRTHRGRITALTYSSCGTFLVGGAENGYIWVINPATMIISEESPLQYTDEKIHLILFSPDSKFIVFTDDECSVGLLVRENDSWKLIGKCMSQKVRDVIFLSTSKFLTITDDRHIVTYIIDKGDISSMASLVVGERFRVEQSAHTTALLQLPGNCLLVANDQFKFKMFDLETFQIKHTFSAPFHDGPIRQLHLLPGDHFMTFMTDNHVYVHLLPIDGNPFKYLGMFAHPKKLKALRNMKDHFVFCCGEGDHGVSMWRINTIPLIENQKHCGSGLDPYCSLLPGGKSGCYVKEMLSLFFYNQISPKNNEAYTEITIRDAMDARDVPNYMRSIGFHMTQFEEDNLVREIDQLEASYLTFEEVVKLFLNHKTPISPSCEEIRSALTYITGGIYETVDLKTFNEMLSTLGEKIDSKTLSFYCSALFPEYTNADPDENGTLQVPLEEFVEKLC